MKIIINQSPTWKQTNQMNGMSMILKSILILFLISYCISTNAQDVTLRNIKWSSAKTTNSVEGNTIDESTSLICYKKDKIEWVDQNGQVRKIFQVIEVIGEWNNPDQEGGLRYEVTDGTYSATIDVRKAAGITTAAIRVYSDPSKTIELALGSFINL